MDGSSVVLHTRFNSVVFPAFALPITRIRKQVYLARSFAASSARTRSSATGGDETAGGGVPCDPGRIAFFSRLKIPLDSLAVRWRSSAISMRVADNKSFRLRAERFFVTPDHRHPNPGLPITSVGCYLPCYLPGTLRPQLVTSLTISAYMVEEVQKRGYMKITTHHGKKRHTRQCRRWFLACAGHEFKMPSFDHMALLSLSLSHAYDPTSAPLSPIPSQG